MTYKENITAILECYFSGFKKEIIDSACNRILEQEPKGHWEWLTENKYRCSNCKHETRVDECMSEVCNERTVLLFCKGAIRNEDNGADKKLCMDMGKESLCQRNELSTRKGIAQI